MSHGYIFPTFCVFLNSLIVLLRLKKSIPRSLIILSRDLRCRGWRRRSLWRSIAVLRRGTRSIAMWRWSWTLRGSSCGCGFTVYPVGLAGKKTVGCRAGGSRRRGVVLVEVHGLRRGLVRHAGGEPSQLVGREVERVGVAVVAGRAPGVGGGGVRIGAAVSSVPVFAAELVERFLFRGRGRGSL